MGLGLSGALLIPATGEAGILDIAWTAPAVNIDGSLLTDLASYRVYYGTSGTPCPDSSFVLVSSPTTPLGTPSGQPVAIRLTGLSPGTRYYVSITAVNSSGLESACSSPVPSAIARPDFAVSPTGIVNFGSVNVGSFGDHAFAVQNTAGGTVSGTVVTSAPFGIVSGSPFTLVGMGATQSVTVRFSPTAQATVMTNVNFTANGGTISGTVSGSGTDPIPPTVGIASPTFNPTYGTSDPLLTLQGTAADNVGVTQVTWANDRGGGGTASGTTSWTVPQIELQLGTNILTVTAQDAAGNTARTSLNVTLSGTSASTDDPVAAQSTLIQAVHILEIRAAIDSICLARGLATFGWTDPTLTPGSTPVKAVHLTELRTALNQAYQAAGRATPAYTDPTLVPQRTVIKAIHLNELRAAVRALE